jgi:UDP-2,4-diacetamido-2,4,6-trideoxy-beta-L-altropyranose hydrolase
LKIAIRCDAGGDIGGGHAIRCLALAQQAVRQQHKVTFCVKNGTKLIGNILSDGPVGLEKITSSNDFLETIKKRRPDWVVLDGYQFSSDLEVQLRQFTRVLTIDDYAHRKSYEPDLLLNQNISAKESWYTARGLRPEQLLLGTDYVLLRRQFLEYNVKNTYKSEKVEQILITVGKSEQKGALRKILDGVKPLVGEFEIIHILGKKPSNFVSTANMKFYSHVNNMAELLEKIDLAVSGGGSTLWELAYMGIPTLAVILTDNQEQVVQELDRSNIYQSLGWINNSKPNIIKEKMVKLLDDKALRKQMRRRSQELIDGKGSERVLRTLKNMIGD